MGLLVILYQMHRQRDIQTHGQAEILCCGLFLGDIQYTIATLSFGIFSLRHDSV